GQFDPELAEVGQDRCTHVHDLGFEEPLNLEAVLECQELLCRHLGGGCVAVAQQDGERGGQAFPQDPVALNEVLVCGVCGICGLRGQVDVQRHQSRGVGVAFHDPQDVLDQRPVAQSRVQDEWGIDLVTPAQYVYEGGFFVGEVVQHPGVGEPRVGGDVAEGDRAVAGAGEQFGGGVDDALPSALEIGRAHV